MSWMGLSHQGASVLPMVQVNHGLVSKRKKQGCQQQALNVSLEGSAREMGVSFTQEGSTGLIQGFC